MRINLKQILQRVKNGIHGSEDSKKMAIEQMEFALQDMLIEHLSELKERKKEGGSRDR